NGGAQVDVLGRQGRPHLAPPVQERGLPGLQRPLQPPVLGEVDVVGDALGVVDGHAQARFRSNSARWPVPYRRSAPSGPAAFGLLKIQFCHAVRRGEILVFVVFWAGEGRVVSITRSASGEGGAGCSSGSLSSGAPPRARAPYASRR